MLPKTPFDYDHEMPAGSMHHPEDREALMVKPKPESDGLHFVSLHEAISRLAGATGIKDAEGGASLIRAIGEHAAFARAKSIGLSPELAEKMMDLSREEIKSALTVCESPIERRLLPALVFADYGPDFHTFPVRIHLPKFEHLPPQGDLVLIPQFAFVKYRLDFAIITKARDRRMMWCVECDGDAYHNNPEKYRSDKERDNYLIGFDIEMFRISGKEIYKDANEVAQNIATVIKLWAAAQ